MLQKRVLVGWLFLVVTATLLWIGCGGSSQSNTLSAAQAQAIAQQVVAALAQAIATAASGNPNPPMSESHRHLTTALSGLRPDTSSGCTTTSMGQTCNFPFSSSSPCPSGGSISVSGAIDGTLTTSGSGSLSTQLTVTPTNCATPTVTFNGDPNITVDGQIGFSNASPTFPVTLTEGGGISYGPNPSGSCQLSVKYSINSLTSCTVTGTVCGQSVNGSC